MKLPLHGGDQGFESTRLHSEKREFAGKSWRMNKSARKHSEPIYFNRTATRHESVCSRAQAALSCMSGEVSATVLDVGGCFFDGDTTLRCAQPRRMTQRPAPRAATHLSLDGLQLQPPRGCHAMVAVDE